MPGAGLFKRSPIGSSRSAACVTSSRAIGHELPRDRIVRIASVDEAGDVRRDGDRVAGADLGHRGAGGFGNEALGDQIIDRRQLARKFRHAGGHASVS